MLKARRQQSPQRVFVAGLTRGADQGVGRSAEIHHIRTMYTQNCKSSSPVVFKLFFFPK